VPQAEEGLYHLTDQTFYRHIRSGDHFVKFYAPWCGHCQRLAPTWSELGKEFEADPIVSIAKFDCTAHESICHDNEVKGYPTLHFFRDGERVAVFRGNRLLPELRDFVKEHKRKPEVQKAQSITEPQDFEAQITSGTSIINFYKSDSAPCQKVEPVLDKMATQYSEVPEVNFLKVNCGEDNLTGLCENEEVKKYPTMILYKNGDRRASLEDASAMTFNKLMKFVHKHRMARDEL